MKIGKNHGHHAFAFIEVLVLFFVGLLFLYFMLPGCANNHRRKFKSTPCISNLRLVATGFYVALADYGKFPMEISKNAGGSLEVCENQSSGDNAALVSYQTISNYIKNPRVLLCPTSTNPAATSWVALSGSNVSYFISATVFTNVPDLVVWGDSNIEHNKTKLSLYPRFNPLVEYRWTPELHRTRFGGAGGGNIVFMDGSVRKRTHDELNASIKASVSAYKLESSFRERKARER